MRKKTNILIYMLSMMGLILLLSNSCKKKDDNSNPNPTPGTVTDIEGNVYHTVTIGTQVWMVENLKTTKYNDGTAIPLITDSLAWGNLTTPGYCWYRNDAATYKNIYGALYNWHTVNTGKLAPAGWHVPTDNDWAILTTYLGGDGIAGGKMKEMGTVHWLSPNTGANNSSGFTGLPGGERLSYGEFYYIGKGGNCWSATESNAHSAFRCQLDYESESTYRGGADKARGFSVRCVKD